jgi:hypothetical protein
LLSNGAESIDLAAKNAKVAKVCLFRILIFGFRILIKPETRHPKPETRKGVLMNYFDLYSSYPDHTISAAWDSQVKEADTTPWLAETLTECGGDLFARFAACYAELRALPRSARRALQRQLARSSKIASILPEYLQQGGRRLQHRMAWSLAGAALLLALGQGVATAATINVTTNDPRIAADGQCSLVEAIVNANNDAATHPDCPAGSGADTIVLPAKANVMLSNAHETLYTYYANPIGLPLITSRITIEGNGAIIAREGTASAFGLMAVTNSGDLTLQSVTLRGGSSPGGGGVYNAGGTLSIKNSTISGNTAYMGGGISNYAGTLAIENSTISGNTADRGGGVFNSFSIYSSFSGILTITNSTISGNHANQGGGVFNFQLCHGNPSFPGYDHCHTPALTLNRSLIAGNQAATGPEIESSIIIHNFMGPPPLNNVNANNFNLFGSDGNAGISGFTPGPNDIVPGVPLAKILGPLQNNGGPTQTHALVDGSPALDAGDPGGCQDSSGALLTTDQRGFARHVDSNNDGSARCDIGAIEAKELFVVAAVLPSSRSVQVGGSPATAFATIINAGQALATGCTISPITGIPATFTFQTTDPATNQVTNSPGTAVDIPGGAAQSFIFALTPTGQIVPTDVQLSFECTNANRAPIIPGVNTLLFSASATQVPDIVALAATLNNDGIVNILGTNGAGVFAVATVNVGAGDAFTVSADTGGAILPVNVFVCQTDPQTSICLSPLATSVPTTILSNETPTFGIFVAGAGDVAFVPETNRIFVRFKDSGGATRGLTSVAVRTQ